MDVFSFSNDEPYRIEFFGDEVESIRTFDVETQLSQETLKKISIIPNVENKLIQEKRESFLKYIPGKSVVLVKNEALLLGGLDKLFPKAEDTFKEMDTEIKLSEPSELFCNSALLRAQMKDYTKVFFSEGETAPTSEITFSTAPQPSFNKQFNVLIEHLN